MLSEWELWAVASKVIKQHGASVDPKEANRLLKEKLAGK